MIDNKGGFKVKCDRCGNLKPICYTGIIALCSECFNIWKKWNKC